MTTRRIRLLFRAAALGVAAPSPPAPSPPAPSPPAPAPSPITAAILALNLPAGAQTLDVGAVATAPLAPGLAGSFQFTRDGLATYLVGTTLTAMPSVAGPVNSAQYTGTALDADKRVNVIASNIVYTAGLTASLDALAVVSLYGTATTGSTLTAAAIAGAKGTITIKAGNGSTVATASSATSASYTVQAGVSGPFTATLSNLTLSGNFSHTAGAVDPAPFLSIQAYMAGATTAAGDVFVVRLADGVTGTINFTSNGGAVTTNPTPQLNSWSYDAVSADIGHTIGYVVSNLSWSTGGVYGTPVLQSATSAPYLYSLDITDDVRNRIRIGVPSLNNLDTTSTPSLGDFALSGTIAVGKTITGISVDNSDADTKYIYLTVSSNFGPSDAPTLTYTQGSNGIRYPGGAPMASFSQPVYSAIPPLATLMYLNGNVTSASSSSPGVVLFNSSNGTDRLAELVLVQSSTDRLSTRQSCLIQMSILADWGTDSSFVRAVGMNNFPPTYGYWTKDAHSLMRQGNTVTLRQKTDSGDNHAIGSSYTFPSPGANCFARIRFSTDDGLARLETSEDGQATWTLRQLGVAIANDFLSPTVFSNSTTVPVTGVGSIGFEPV